MFVLLQVAGLGHHDEEDSDSLSSGAVSNSDSGRGPSSDEGPGGAAGSQAATLARNKQGKKSMTKNCLQLMKNLKQECSIWLLSVQLFFPNQPASPKVHCIYWMKSIIDYLESLLR